MTEIEASATRTGRNWSVRVPGYLVYGRGATLKAAKASAEAGLALIGVIAEIRLIPQSAELENLRAAEAEVETARETAVRALHLRKASKRDIAISTGLPYAQVKRILAEHSERGTAPESSPTSTQTLHHELMTPQVPSTADLVDSTEGTLLIDYPFWMLYGGPSRENLLPNGQEAAFAGEECAIPSAQARISSPVTISEWDGPPPAGPGELIGEGTLDCPQGELVVDTPATGSDLRLRLGVPGLYGVRVWRIHEEARERQEFDVRLWLLEEWPPGS
ncbi:hypothetical protein ACIRBX_12120 [Kitasatospora sp. NPDC096147]|uniref:hypothetical protein n=1 Tax=Kitasatospora sp. NPDC096147 TaxID=3364093 RepID=UPI0038013B75